MIVWASHVKVEHRQGLIKESPIRKSRAFLRLRCRIFASRSDKAETSAQGEVSDLHSSYSLHFETMFIIVS